MRSRIAPALLALGGLALSGAIVGACAARLASSPAPTAIAASPGARSDCAGSARVATVAEGAAADTLEQLQGTYEGRPGFLAVVYDGTNPVVVVGAARMQEWLADLAPKGISVAASCIDPGLLDAVKAAVPALTPPDGIASDGYNAIDDSIDVIGVPADALLAALDRQQPGMGDRARAAIAAGTLRISGDKVSGARVSPSGASAGASEPSLGGSTPPGASPPSAPMSFCPGRTWPPYPLAGVPGITAVSTDRTTVEITNHTGRTYYYRVSGWEPAQFETCQALGELERQRGPIAPGATEQVMVDPSWQQAGLRVTVALWDKPCGEACSSEPNAAIIVELSPLEPAAS